MKDAGTNPRRFHLSICALGLWALSAAAQISGISEVPSQFKLDVETAARLKPELMALSVAATGRYTTGRAVFEQLVEQVQSASLKPSWQLRIVEDGQLNAYASPDGTVYVESGLAELAGHSAGLWAAILSHEVVHVVRRDWARRYLFQKQMEGEGGSIVLGEPGLLPATWIDSEKASTEMAKFCRQLELEADREGVMLMAKAGFHPDFVPALHHLLHARGVGSSSASAFAMHPCWQERDRELAGAYQQASIEFEHRWTDWYASPGGNPPVVVFAYPPSVRRSASKTWEIDVPMRCQNLAGAVEVVLRANSDWKRIKSGGQPSDLSDIDGPDSEVRQLTGCTSPRTTVVFTAADLLAKQGAAAKWIDVYVVDAWGSVLARADLPKLPH